MTLAEWFNNIRSNMAATDAAVPPRLQSSMQILRSFPIPGGPVKGSIPSFNRNNRYGRISIPGGNGPNT